ncbi:uncharacterized protein L203_101069 [Cryptococcus depauperatus CBS 7841]|uniref:Uncharacterized protein n=1 Tax=Cryptococcus depauperatus CBS 7841 TaxID=1295531 RepID=A0AAJ8JPD0_9TREE
MNFSPYQPPPDVPSTDPPEVKPKSKKPNASEYNAGSYQSGGSISDPSAVPQAFSSDPESAGLLDIAGDRANAWESRFGWRIDVMAAATYLAGPASETTMSASMVGHPVVSSAHSAAYQSALLTTPLLVLFLVFKLLIRLPSFLKTIFILASLGTTLYASFKAWYGAQQGLDRFYLPWIGAVADRWLGEE